MKKTGKCPKCASGRIIGDAKVVDRGDGNLAYEMKIATFGNPGAMIFKDKRETTVSAWVCAACGYVEFYADAPGDLVPPGGG